MTSIQTRRWRPLHWRSRCHSSAPYLSRNEAPGHRKGTECYTKQNRKHAGHKRVDMAVWHRITPDTGISHFNPKHCRRKYDSTTSSVFFDICSSAVMTKMFGWPDSCPCTTGEKRRRGWKKSNSAGTESTAVTMTVKWLISYILLAE